MKGREGLKDNLFSLSYLSLSTSFPQWDLQQESSFVGVVEGKRPQQKEFFPTLSEWGVATASDHIA